MAAITATGLVKTYRSLGGRTSVEAVRGLDFNVERGRIFGLLGPNGSGKTTTLHMLLGLLRPTAGEIRVLDVPAGHREARKRTGFLPEETNLFGFLSGEETVDFVGRLFGLKRDVRRKRTEELLQRTGMWETRKRRQGTYRKGMARRIGLAQALVGQPELLVLDEPTSGLDPLGNREIKDLLREKAQAGMTILLSSHLLADVADVCDDIAIFNRGKKILAGEVQELLSSAERMVWETGPVADEQKRKIEAKLTEEGVQLYGVQRARTTLEKLFMDALRRADEGADGG